MRVTDYKLLADAAKSTRHRYAQKGENIGEIANSVLDYFAKYLAYYIAVNARERFNQEVFKEQMGYGGTEDNDLVDPRQGDKKKPEVFPVDVEFVKKLGVITNVDQNLVDEMADALSGEFAPQMAGYAKEWLKKRMAKANR